MPHERGGPDVLGANRRCHVCVWAAVHRTCPSRKCPAEKELAHARRHTQRRSAKRRWSGGGSSRKGLPLPQPLFQGVKALVQLHCDGSAYERGTADTCAHAKTTLRGLVGHQKRMENTQAGRYLQDKAAPRKRVVAARAQQQRHLLVDAETQIVWQPDHILR